MKHESDEKDWFALRILLSGMLGMVVAMGIGRFAFTPILPLMQRDLGMINSVAGWLAGLNYLGYLAGAVGCSFAPRLLRRAAVVGGAWALSLGTTFFMGTTLSVFWWGSMRLVGGVASAVLFIAISAEIAETLARRGYGHWIGSLYGGIGFGIALSGLSVPLLDMTGGWSGSWIGMGILAALLAVAGTFLGRGRDKIRPASTGESSKGGLRRIRPLAAAYFFEGLGYVVTATFIVAIIAVTPGLESFAPYSWVAVGLAAVPSTVFWPWLARRVGAKRALLSAYVLQSAGILVSIGADTIVEVLFAAVSFGGTFLGIVALTLAEGSRRSPGEGGRAAAILTACFSVGQMLGPVFAGILADFREGFALPLVLAASCVLAGAVFIALDRRYQ